jgi:hypothetical protein
MMPINHHDNPVLEILQDCLDALSFRSPDVLCLGLGSPLSSRESRAQLAFLLNICKCFDIVSLLLDVSVCGAKYNITSGSL